VSASHRPTRAARVAVLERRGRFLVAEPFFERGQRLTLSRDRRANAGDLVLLRAQGGRDGSGAGRAQIARRIGRPDVARDVIEALMLDRGLRRSFDPAVEREARAAAEPIDHGDGGDAVGARRDLRSLTTFTIDPAGARDFDDALSAQAIGEDAWRVWVHIADVSAYVRPGTLVDREAYRRGTSVYVPGAVEPMLPEALSNRACSLVPGQDRLAVTAELVVRGDGVSNASFYRSLIRSDEGLDYDRVDRIFAGQQAPGALAEPLACARAAAAALAARRASRGALVLGSAEPEFEFDRAGNVIASRPVAQTESHRLIEHLMIAANEQVARVLEERGAPALFRVHERPTAPAVERLIDQLASLGVPTPALPRGAMTPQQAADIVGEASQLVEGHLATHGGRGRRALTRLVLRALKQAYYDPRNLGHAGLQSPRYCHFTSPIRRYPDLVCHRSLLAAIGGGDEVPPDRAGLPAVAKWSSEREREAMTIERDADDVALCFLLERSLHSLGREATFDGEVVGLVGAGAFVQFGSGDASQRFEGMLPVRHLRGEWWELNDQQTVLVGTSSGRAIRLGDPVRVQVGTIDAPRGRVDLLPVEV
jgi:ribonuclease R